MAFKTVLLSKDNDISITGCMITRCRGQFAVLPVHKGGMSNYKSKSGSGDYDGGDRVIGFPNGYEIDGDLLFSVGWGDGFAVRRLNNDGTMTRLFHDSNFLWRDTSSTYNHLQSVAIDKVNKLGVVMTYNVEGYTTFDYSGCTNGGTTFVKDARPSHSNPDFFIGSQDTGNGYVNRCGTSYTSGLCAAGAWFYAGDHDAHHYKKLMRRNLNSDTEERLDMTSSSVYKSGSSVIDRNGYRHCIFYDEINDRIFWFPYYNANFTMVLDASTSSPETVWCDLGDAGEGDDGYEQGLYIEDPVNSPNIVCVGGSSRLLKINIGPCLTGSAPTIIKRVELFNNWVNNLEYPVNFRFGTKYQKTSGTPMDKSPGFPAHCPTHADRGWATVRGFVDWDNNQTATALRHDDVVEDTTTGGRGRSHRLDYGNGMVLMSSANGTKYWIQLGYGADGHSITIWDEDDKPNELIGNWELIHGTFTLPNSANIDKVHIGNAENFKVPANCTLTVFVSNNNGTSYETYDRTSDDAHVFSSTGTQLRVKIVAGGRADRSPYYVGNKGFLSVSYGSMHDAAKNSNIKFKITRKRLR
ncbi:hypothetical protein N8445_00340 [bacterium]|nr:hypothetical protein [bacterium]